MTCEAHWQVLYLLVHGIGLSVLREEQIEFFYGFGICHEHGKHIVDEIHPLPVYRLIRAKSEIGAVINAPRAAVGLIVDKEYRHNIAGGACGNIFDRFGVYRLVAYFLSRVCIYDRCSRTRHGVAHTAHLIYIRLHEAYAAPR